MDMGMGMKKKLVDIKGIMSVKAYNNGMIPFFEVSLNIEFVQSILDEFNKCKKPAESITMLVIGSIK